MPAFNSDVFEEELSPSLDALSVLSSLSLELVSFSSEMLFTFPTALGGEPIEYENTSV